MPRSGALRLFWRWNSTQIERMTFTGDGMMNLPVEIWEKIFTIATVASQHHLDSSIIDLSAPPAMLWEHPELLDVYQGEAKPAPYSTRRSFTLVCKSWYFMTNHILWSNLFINLQGPSTVIDNLSRILARNKILAELVACLVVRDGDRELTVVNEESARGERPRNIRILNKILPNLTRLRMISSPRYLAEKATWKVRPDLVMIYDQYGCPNKGDKWMYGCHFWDGCKTLIVNHNVTPYQYNPFESYATPPIFSDMINLRISVKHPSPVQYMAAMWELPRLQSLSVSGPGVLTWINFFKRVSETLKILEIDVESGVIKFPILSAITMPNLSTLCLRITADLEVGDRPIFWINYITAPRLNRIVLYHIIPNHDEHSVDDRGTNLQGSEVPVFVGRVVHSAINRYSTLRVLTFAIGSRSRSTWRGVKEISRAIIEWNNVKLWVSLGLEIELINHGEKFTYRLTDDDFTGSS